MDVLFLEFGILQACVDTPNKLEFEPPLDDGIRRAVELLSNAGVETYESCEGGDGHAYLQPTVRFHGDRSEGFRVLALILQNNLPVSALKRIWVVNDGEPAGPYWEVVFWEKLD
jgi:hypothetical protein